MQQSIGGQVTNYLWDETAPYGDVILETDSGGAETAGYVLAGGRLISQRRGGATSYYLADGQGSVRALADSAGNLTDRYTYTAFGETLETQGSTPNAYRYTGQQFDALTGLYSLRARYYAPADGRFLSRDTFAVSTFDPLEINRYVYAANNPATLSDPSGYNSTQETALIDTNSLLLGTAAVAVTGLAIARALPAILELLRDLPIPYWRPPYLPDTDVAKPQTQPKPLSWDDFPVAPQPVGPDIVILPRFDDLTRPQPQPQPEQTGTDTETEPQDEEKPRKTIVDLGSGTQGLWARTLKMLNPKARVIATEKGDKCILLQGTLWGSGVEVNCDWNTLPPGMADETWAVAPQPESPEGVGYILAGKAGLKLTKPGGVFHMVITQYEREDEDGIRMILHKVDEARFWMIMRTTLSRLGIPIDVKKKIFYSGEPVARCLV